MDKKVCSKCGEVKVLTEFNRRLDSKDGLRYYCRECQKYMAKRYSEKKGDEIKEKRKLWRINNLDFAREVDRKSKLKHAKKIYQKNKERYNTDKIFRLKQLLRKRLRDILLSKKISKSVHIMDLIGCSVFEFKEHLEKQFNNGMTWDNQGKWHIDHKIPLASVNTEEELYKLCHYTNLQPLWAEDNLKKGSKII
jgi:hypothetical protein